jgi:hypothetical protein
MVSLASALFLPAVLSRVSAGEAFPTFTLSLSPCPGPVEAAPGAPWETEIGVILTTTYNSDPQFGAVSWSISMTAEGADITEITTQGTLAASVEDDPPGLRQRGFERSRAGVIGLGGLCDGRKGAVSSVALSITGTPVTLPPVGAALIARIKVAGKAPVDDGGRKTPVRIFFLDGCRGDGGPIANNVTTMDGASWQPVTEDCEFEVTAIEPRFRRGDANGDGTVNITDAIAVLACKFSGEACPSCRDAADVNDDGTDNITDPIRLLNHLFIGDRGLPLPGPTDCGVDPTADTLAPCVDERCGA